MLGINLFGERGKEIKEMKQLEKRMEIYKKKRR